VTPLRFVVYGVPIPKGSTRAFVPKGWTRPIITADNAKTKPWQESVVSAAREALAGAAPIAEPVSLTVSFYLPRPKSAPKRVTRPTKKPDLDKLLRCVKDGLTRAGVYRDDAQVIEVLAGKAFAGGSYDTPGGVPRAVIEVRLTE
jgi:Holliday junction resolvase RusA-like endonuclease